MTSKRQIDAMRARLGLLRPKGREEVLREVNRLLNGSEAPQPSAKQCRPPDRKA